VSCIGLCAVVIAISTNVAPASVMSPPPPRVRAAHGWVVIPSLLVGLSPRRTAASASRSSLVAVTAGDAARLGPFDLFESLTRLRRTGIVILATTIGRHRPGFRFPSSRFPLHLGSFRVDHGWEGQPAANVEQRVRLVNVGIWDLDVRVYFATQSPGSRLLAHAQAELDRLVLPRG